MATRFTPADVPDQTGRTIFVTGANSGLGFHAAEVLAGKGARVLLGCRSRGKALAAEERIRLAHPSADLAFVELDLADLSSVRTAAQEVAKERRLDVLINNAGVMMPPKSITKDGFELQFGVNHLGGFALTGLLLDKLTKTEGSRIVITASLAHERGTIFFDDLKAERHYARMQRYAQSKLANLLHMAELDRRLRAAKIDVMALACHPGIARTELMRHLPKPFQLLAMPLVGTFMNSAAEGAWPTLAAATAPGAKGGDYWGPARFGEWSGPAHRVEANATAKDPALAERLWEVSEKLTGVTYPI